jgi:Tfp pilus assembly protein PilF
MSDNRRWVRWALLLGLILLIGVGIAGFFYLRRGIERTLATGEKAYASGLEAFQAKDYSTAIQRFDEAALLASKALDQIDRESKGKDQSEQAVGRRKDQAGRAFWLKARALRDQAYARGLAEGKPLLEITDNSTGETYRSALKIPDNKVLNEAYFCFRQAGILLPRSPEAQLDALRVELPQRNWPLIERLCEQILAIDPKDSRAHYVLAWYHYDQFQTDSKGRLLGATPPEKRSLNRMNEAREHLKKSEEADGGPRWRTLHLGAKITRWYRDEYTRKGQPAKAAKEEKALHELLLNEKSGVLARAAKDKELVQANILQVQDILGLHEMAMEMAAAEARQSPEQGEVVWKVLDGTLDVCKRLTAGEASPLELSAVAESAVTVASTAQTFVTAFVAKRWEPQLEAVEALGRRALKAKVSSPSLYTGLARLYDREAQAAARRGDSERQTRLRAQAIAWVEDGLKAGQAAKRKPAELVDLHLLALERKALAPKRQDYSADLAALKESGLPQALSLVQFVEGLAAERDGKLDEARRHLEAALPQAVPTAAPKINVALGNVYLALGRPDRALVRLAAAEPYYRQLDALPENERAWTQGLASRDELDYLLLVANLDTARQKIRRFQKENPPNTPMPYDQIKANEETANRLLTRLKTGSRGAAAEALLVTYLAGTGRADKAAEKLAAAQKQHPDSLRLLQLQAGLTLIPKKPGEKIDRAKAVAEGDRLINQFITDHPRDRSARLFKAVWLTRTGRSDQAVAYLEDRANFPADRDDVYKRVLAQAFLGKGKRDEAERLLGSLPRDPAVDDALIRLASSTDEREKRITAAMARYERNGLFRCWDATLAAGKGKHTEAANGFFKALAFTRVKATAEQGLWRSMVAMAQSDPSKARSMAEQMIREAPEEPIPYLALAYTSLLLDNLGAPSDAWGRSKSMAAALNAWEQLAVRQGADRERGPLTKAAFWAQASRSDLARAEVRRALSYAPRNPEALTLAIRLATEGNGPEAWDQGRKHLATLKEIQPNSPTPLLLDAALEQAAGQDDKAVSDYVAVLDKHPDQGPAYASLVSLLLEKGDTEKAALWLGRWRKQSPEDFRAAASEVWELAQAGQLDRAREIARKAVDDQVERERKRLAEEKPAAGTNPDEHAKEQDRKLQAARDAAEVQMAGAFLRGGALDESEVWARRVLDRSPEREDARLMLGNVMLKRKDWAKTRDFYTAALKASPKNFIVANNLAWILATQFDQPAEARRIIEPFRKGRFSDQPLPGDRLRPEFLDTLGEIYRRLKTPDAYEEMRDLFEAARHTHPSDPRVYLYLGEAHAGLKNLAGAREMFATAIALSGPEAKNSLSPDDRARVLKEAEAARKALPTRSRPAPKKGVKKSDQ